MKPFTKTTKLMEWRTTSPAAMTPSSPTQQVTQDNNAEPPPAYTEIGRLNIPTDSSHVRSSFINRSASSRVSQVQRSSDTTSLVRQISVRIPRTEEDNEEQLPAYTARIPAAVPASCITTRDSNGKIGYRFSVHPNRVTWNPARRDAAPGPCVVQ